MPIHRHGGTLATDGQGVGHARHRRGVARDRSFRLGGGNFQGEKASVSGEKMTFALIPCGTDDMASSRIRVYTLLKSLCALGQRAVLGPARDADVLFVQKRWDLRTISAARRARSRGAAVFFDVDDAVVTDNPSFHRMLRLAHVVTTDTAGRRDWLRARYGLETIEILPDSVDYAPAAPARPPIRRSRRLRLLWFGGLANVRLLAKHLPALCAIDDLEVVAAGHENDLSLLRPQFPAVTFVAWTRSGFIELLQGCDACFLPHDGTQADLMKSNNKMITSIIWGVPAVVSATPEYKRTAIDSGVAWCAFEDEPGLRGVIEKMRAPEVREAYLSTAQPRVWVRYGLEAVARDFLALARRHAEQARRGAGSSWAEPSHGSLWSAWVWGICEAGRMARDLLAYGTWKATDLLRPQP